MPPLPPTAVFDDLPGPRRDTENKLHRLTDVLTITPRAVIGGAETWEAIAEYGRTQEAFFRRFPELPNGTPSADTFGRVSAKLAPGAFAEAFGRWMAAGCEATGVVPVAIDGKSAVTTGFDPEVALGRGMACRHCTAGSAGPGGGRPPQRGADSGVESWKEHGVCRQFRCVRPGSGFGGGGVQTGREHPPPAGEGLKRNPKGGEAWVDISAIHRMSRWMLPDRNRK